MIWTSRIYDAYWFEVLRVYGRYLVVLGMTCDLLLRSRSVTAAAQIIPWLVWGRCAPLLRIRFLCLRIR